MDSGKYIWFNGKFNEAFFVGTAVEINSIGQIDKIKIGNGGEGEVTAQFKKIYFEIVRGKIKKYDKWLSRI